MKKSTKGFIGGFLLEGFLTPIVGYFGYKLMKPDYLKDYEEEDDFDDFDDIDNLDDC